MWDEEDGFFYDVLKLPNGEAQRLKVRSMVGLLLFHLTATIHRSRRPGPGRYVRTGRSRACCQHGPHRTAAVPLQGNLAPNRLSTKDEGPGTEAQIL
jgi:hypothetical protein